MGRLLVLFAFAVPAAGAEPYWEVVEEPVPESNGSPVRVALVRNDPGDSLRIYQDDDGVVRAMFTIHPGFDSLVASNCPTYRIDERPPQVISLGSGPCRIEPRHAHFSYGPEEDGRIHSIELHRLMNGTTIVFSYELEPVGYRESAFSLSHSKYAVRQMLGREVEIVKD